MSNLDINKLQDLGDSYSREIQIAFEGKLPVGFTLEFGFDGVDFSCEENGRGTVFKHKDGNLIFNTEFARKSKHLNQLLELAADLTYNLYYVSKFRTKFEGIRV